MFGEWLDKRLDALGWTNAYLANKVGVSTGAVWGWRADRYPPSINTIPKIADAFGISEFEVYCAVRDIDFSQVQDSRLMQLLNLQPGDSERVVRLAGKLIPVLLELGDEMRHEPRTLWNTEGGRESPPLTTAPATKRRRNDQAADGISPVQSAQTRTTWEESVDEERRHQGDDRGTQAALGQAS